MMQPIDVKTQKFKKGLFGYKATEVDDFVSSVGRYYEELFNENAKLKEEKERLEKVIEENNLKIFELEKKVSGNGDSKDAKKDDKKGSQKKEDPKKKGAEEKKDDTATSKFFKKAEETTVVGGDDDEVFVGEIEEARKPSKAMIGDGEEEGGDDFEFL
ncbi:MAG: DivIVA domain-containing protein [Eubacterium sp.]|nr:DivIVA domain-containing protein [Eubacterium sp.]